MKKYYIVYTDTDVRITNKDNAFHCLADGWKLHAITNNIEHADKLELELV